MNKNGRPNLGYSNLFWQKIDNEQRARIYNREELIQEVLSEPEELSIDKLQLIPITEITPGETNDETRCIKITERDENNRHIDAKTYRDAV
jgi:hypothetical protein